MSKFNYQDLFQVVDVDFTEPEGVTDTRLVVMDAMSGEYFTENEFIDFFRNVFRSYDTMTEWQKQWINDHNFESTRNKRDQYEPPERNERTRGNQSPNKAVMIWNKTNGKCWYCGCDIEGKMVIDHVHPFSEGGGDELENLVPSCRPCNSAKRNRSVEEYREYIHRKKGMVIAPDQRAWLESKGLYIPEPDKHQFYFETNIVKGVSNG